MTDKESETTKETPSNDEFFNMLDHRLLNNREIRDCIYALALAVVKEIDKTGELVCGVYEQAHGCGAIIGTRTITLVIGTLFDAITSPDRFLKPTLQLFKSSIHEDAENLEVSPLEIRKELMQSLMLHGLERGILKESDFSRAEGSRDATQSE